MLAQASNFLDDSTGIEKTLRLVQGFCTVLIGLAQTSVAAAPWKSAKSQVNMARRFLRLHKWHGCFGSAYDASTRSDVGGLEKLLEVAKWSFTGLYFLLEMPTITNAMGVTSFPWGARVENEALKCWFYGIAFSLLLGYYQLAMLYLSPPKASKVEANTKDVKPKEEKETATPTPMGKELADADAFQARRSKITNQLITDHCDIFLPGSAVGWIPAGQVGVGTCQSISSILSMRKVWEKVKTQS